MKQLPLLPEAKSPEDKIDAGLARLAEAGRALLAIKRRKLYKQAGFANFEAYCRTKWPAAYVRAALAEAARKKRR
ncbi:MAG TPA: hypothetical protein VFR23_26115 [Jiangellaceae bacterium]|nr:hypothetical protein [Jiangellaceae bacterium]